MDNSRRAGALASALCACLTAAGCGAAQRPGCDADDSIRVHVHPATHLNHDRAGLPRSVVVRLFQLDDARAFERSSFDGVWAGAASLPRPEELVALPGRSQAHVLEREPSARYLAAVANFRERSGESRWRGLAPLPAPSAACARGPGAGAAFELTLADHSLDLR